MNNNILYTGAFRYPDLDAAAHRVSGLCKLLEAQGNYIEIAGWEDGNNSYIHNGYICHPQNEFNDGKVKSIYKRVFGFIFRGLKTLNWIRGNSKFDVYILYNPPAIFAFIMLLFAKINKKKVALDITEWYESSHLIGGKFGIVSIENWFRMRLIYPMFDNIIVISSYLENYFLSKGCNNVVKCFPINVNGLKIKNNDKKDRDWIEFVYAGQPGKKDLLVDFILKLPELKKYLKKNVVLNLVGPQKEEFIKTYESEGYDFKDVACCVRFHGVLNQNKVFDLYSKSDFSILFRDNKRYAKAGFPTKGMESLINGCPILLNDVGDIADVVRATGGGIICVPDDTKFIANAIANNTFSKIDISQKCQCYFGEESYTKLLFEFMRGVNNGDYRD